MARMPTSNKISSTAKAVMTLLMSITFVVPASFGGVVQNVDTPREQKSTVYVHDSSVRCLFRVKSLIGRLTKNDAII